MTLKRAWQTVFWMSIAGLLINIVLFMVIRFREYYKTETELFLDYWMLIIPAFVLTAISFISAYQMEKKRD